MNRKLCILQLSDCHFSPEHKEEMQQVWNKLIRDIIYCRSFYSIDPTLLIFCGDLVNKKQAADFPIAKQALQKLYTEIGLSANNVFIVPGNHDITRMPASSLHDKIVKMMLSGNNSDSFIKDKDALKILSSKLKFFNKNIAGIVNPVCITDGKQKYFYKYDTDINGIKLRICGLNSVLTCRHNEEVNSFIISKTQMLESISGCDDDRIIFYLSHFPLDWLVTNDKHEVERTLFNHGYAYFHGHAHKNSWYNISNFNGKSFYNFGTGAIYNTDNPTDNFYNILEFNFHDRVISVFSREWDNDNEEWVAKSGVGIIDGMIKLPMT